MALSHISPMATPFPVPTHVSSVRIQHAFVNMNMDAFHPYRGASGEEVHNHLRKRAEVAAPTSNTTIVSYNVIDFLWKDPSNQDLVSGFLNNSFCATCATSADEDCLPLYQKYSAQDYFFLEDYVKYKAHRLISIPEGDLTILSAEAASIVNDADYAIGAVQSYVDDLQGNANDLAEENRSIAELAYGNVLQNAASDEDWYNLHIISIPCIYGWTQLAEKLLNDPSTRKDTVFYKTWMEPNADPSYASNLTAFLDANQALWKDELDTTSTGSLPGKWNNLFRTALKLEIALFATAFEK